MPRDSRRRGAQVERGEAGPTPEEGRGEVAATLFTWRRAGSELRGKGIPTARERARGGSGLQEGWAGGGAEAAGMGGRRPEVGGQEPRERQNPGPGERALGLERGGRGTERGGRNPGCAGAG